MQNNECEYCQEKFEVDHKHRNQRFCSRSCMYEWRKDQNWTTSNCLNCGNKFAHRKKQTRIYCSDYCNKHSEEKLEVLAKAARENNQGGSLESIKKIKKKLKGRNVGFGSDGHKVNHTKITKTKMSISTKECYRNNKEEILTKRNETYLKKYGMNNKDWLKKVGDEYAQSLGVKNVFQLPENRLKARSKISKGQQLLYEETRKEHKDAELEYWLSDVQRSVDIFIPSQRKIIEYYGDYWHCNPIKYQSDYYHTVIKKTAKEIWERDKKRERELIDAGYQVTIKWENH